MRCLVQVRSSRQKVVWWLPGPGERDYVYYVIIIGFKLWKMKSSVNGQVKLYSTGCDSCISTDKVVTFILHVFCCNQILKVYVYVSI